MAVRVHLRCGSSTLAVQDGRLVLVVLKDVATWELSYSSPCWYLRYLPVNFQLELRPDNRSISCSPGGPSGQYLEVVRGELVRSRLLYSRAASGAQLGLEVEDGTGPAALLICGTSCEPMAIVHPIYSLGNAKFDYVIIGSSFCCLAFVMKALQNDTNASILILEKGSESLPQHHQSLPPSDKTASKEAVRPWSVSERTGRPGQFIANLHGQIQYLGGRSTYWSGWCPQPSKEDMDGWPEILKQSLPQYFDEAKGLLGVIPANEIKDGSIYGAPQDFIEEKYKASPTISSITGISIQPAPLAMGNKENEKFSTPGPLKDIRCGRVHIVLGCVVEKIEHDGKNKATGLVTSQGHLPLGDAKLILAMSTLPSTTLVLNSFNVGDFPCLANVGKRLTAHFVSSVIARAPRSGLLELPPGQGIQLGAVYIAGKEQAQYHLQLSAAATRGKPGSKDLELCRKYSANSITPACLNDSPDHVIISCSALGELDHKNKDNWFKLEGGVHPDLTSNGELQIVPNKQDLELWDTMDDVMFKVTEACLPGANVEYWHETVKDQGVWKTGRPTEESIRQKYAVHDASTMWMGGDEDTEAPVGLDYRLRGVDNIYITGGALWPTGGSWNPVLTIVAMAMHLADTLCGIDVNETDG